MRHGGHFFQDKEERHVSGFAFGSELLDEVTCAEQRGGTRVGSSLLFTEAAPWLAGRTRCEQDALVRCSIKASQKGLNRDAHHIGVSCQAWVPGMNELAKVWLKLDCAASESNPKQLKHKEDGANAITQGDHEERLVLGWRFGGGCRGWHLVSHGWRGRRF